MLIARHIWEVVEWGKLASRCSTLKLSLCTVLWSQANVCILTATDHSSWDRNPLGPVTLTGCHPIWRWVRESAGRASRAVPRERSPGSFSRNFLQLVVIDSGSSSYEAGRLQSLRTKCPQENPRESGERQWIGSADFSSPEKSRLHTLCSYIIILLYVTSAHLGGRGCRIRQDVFWTHSFYILYKEVASDLPLTHMHVCTRTSQKQASYTAFKCTHIDIIFNQLQPYIWH